MRIWEAEQKFSHSLFACSKSKGTHRSLLILEDISGSFSNFGRSKNFNVERRVCLTKTVCHFVFELGFIFKFIFQNNSYRTYRFGAANSSQSKHHLVLRNRDADIDNLGVQFLL